MDSDEVKSVLKRMAAILGVAIMLAAVVIGAGVFYVSQKYPAGPPKKTSALVSEPTASPGGGSAQNSAGNIKTLSFGSPYPVSWQESGAKLSLTGISLGKIGASTDLWKIPGVSYGDGEEIYALILNLKIEIINSYGASVPLNLRRLINEEGELLSPNTKGFVFPDSGGNFGGPGKTYENQKVIFVVPETAKELDITTGGSTNIFFTITISDDGSLKLEKTAEIG